MNVLFLYFIFNFFSLALIMSSDEDEDENFYPDCHMTWEWAVIKLKNKTNLYHRDRIDAIEKTIQTRSRQQSKRDIQNLYTLQGFFYLKWYETEDGRADLVEKSKQCFLDALKECSNENTGYKYIIYGNLYLCSKALKETAAKEKEYHEHCIMFQKEEISEYEICEMKGFMASYLHLYADGIKFTKQALELEKTPSGYFGLAIIMDRKAKARGRFSKEDNKNISNNLQKAIELDQSYYEAMLRLARIYQFLSKRARWNEKNFYRDKVVKLINQVISDVNDKPWRIVYLEECAFVLSKHDRKLGSDLYHECLRTNRSQKVLRGLGNNNFLNWRIKKYQNYKVLKKAVEYFDELIKMNNEKIFDFTTLGTFHLKACQFYKDKNRYQRQFQHHKNECQRVFKEVEAKMNKDRLDLQNRIETLYSLSMYYAEFPNRNDGENQELDILKKALVKSLEDQDEYKELISVKSTRNRLVELSSNNTGISEWEKAEVNSLLSRSKDNIPQAIEYLNQAEELGCEEPDFIEKILVQKAECYLQLLEIPATNNSSCAEDFEKAVRKIKAGSASKLSLISRYLSADQMTVKEKITILESSVKADRKDDGKIQDTVTDLLCEVKSSLKRGHIL